MGGEHVSWEGPRVPARTCVEVSRLPFNFKVEIEAVAHT